MAERILVLDDEAQITLLRASLAAHSYDVRIANDPEEGLRLVDEWMPDLLITDLMMPG